MVTGKREGSNLQWQTSAYPSWSVARSLFHRSYHLGKYIWSSSTKVALGPWTICTSTVAMLIGLIGDCQLATLQELDLPDKFSCVYVREHNCLELIEIIQEVFTQFGQIVPTKTWEMQKIARIIPCVHLVWTNTPSERGNHKCFMHVCILCMLVLCISVYIVLNKR